MDNALLGAAAGAGGGILGGLFGSQGQKAAAAESARQFDKEQTQRNIAYNLLTRAPEINLDYSAYTPEMLQYIAEPNYEQYATPETLAAILPSEQQTAESRALQMQALNDLLGTTESGISSQEKANLLRTRMAAEESARGEMGSITEQMARTGRSGSGLSDVLQGIAGQAAANRIAQSGMDEAALSEQARRQALSDLLTGSGSVRGQDYTAAKNSADILNDFAIQNSVRQQQINNMNTQQRNAALASNVGQQRQIANANVGLSNEAQKQNLETQRQNQLMNQQSQIAKAQAQSGALLGAIPSMQAYGQQQSAAAAAPYNMAGGMLSSVGGAMSDYFKQQGTNDLLNKYLNAYKPAAGAGIRETSQTDPLYGEGEYA